jgi:hypothetical protein
MSLFYIGLTDNPLKKKLQHGSPEDWCQTGPFISEQAAKDWKKQYLGKPGFRVKPGGEGWKYGYWFKITPRKIR